MATLASAPQRQGGRWIWVPARSTGDGSQLINLPAGTNYWAAGAVGINTTASVGIGSTSPAYSLDVRWSGKIGAGLITPMIYPSADSTTAIQMNKADGTTNVLNVDTTNGRVGIWHKNSQCTVNGL